MNEHLKADKRFESYISVETPLEIPSPKIKDAIRITFNIDFYEYNTNTGEKNMIGRATNLVADYLVHLKVWSVPSEQKPFYQLSSWTVNLAVRDDEGNREFVFLPEALISEEALGVFKKLTQKFIGTSEGQQKVCENLVEVAKFVGYNILKTKLEPGETVN